MRLNVCFRLATTAAAQCSPNNIIVVTVVRAIVDQLLSLPFVVISVTSRYQFSEVYLRRELACARRSLTDKLSTPLSVSSPPPSPVFRCLCKCAQIKMRDFAHHMCHRSGLSAAIAAYLRGRRVPRLDHKKTRPGLGNKTRRSGRSRPRHLTLSPRVSV